MNICPLCGSKTRSIEPVTLLAQVVAERLDSIDEQLGWALCMSGVCEVVYFRGADTVLLGQTRAAPFHKSDDPARLVCFCFEHSVAGVEADAREHGRSTIQASIKAACKAGGDDCARKNPQGRCCLGNVGWVVKRVAVDAEHSDCCASAGASGEE